MKAFKWMLLTVSEGSSMIIMTERTAAGRLGAGAAAESLHPEQ